MYCHKVKLSLDLDQRIVSLIINTRRYYSSKNLSNYLIEIKMLDYRHAAAVQPSQLVMPHPGRKSFKFHVLHEHCHFGQPQIIHEDFPKNFL